MSNSLVAAKIHKANLRLFAISVYGVSIDGMGAGGGHLPANHGRLIEQSLTLLFLADIGLGTLRRVRRQNGGG